MPIERLKEFLEDQDVEYTVIPHSVAYTAQEIAALTHIKGRELAKTVMIKVDGKMAMAVLPASFQVDLGHLGDAIGAGQVELASEAEFKNLFPQCEIGAMPPFGNLYGLPTYCSRELAEDSEIAFNAGSHAELLRLAWDDYQRLVQPRMLEFAAAPVGG